MIRRVIGTVLLVAAGIVAVFLLAYHGPILPHIVGPIILAVAGAILLTAKKKAK
jgi:uncharacterized membrane protein YccC